jgi:hypothetical protein
MAGSPRIAIARTGERDGLVIAVVPGEDPYVSSARLVVGDVRRISRDGEPETWRAWLWPRHGGAMHVTQSCAAIDAGTPELLLGKLQQRADGDGPWWRGAA